MINTIWIRKPDIYKSLKDKVVVVTGFQSVGFGHPMIIFRVLDEGKNYKVYNKDFLDMFERYDERNQT